MEYEPTGSAEATLTVTRSRFIAYVEPATTPAQAHHHIKQHKLGHATASWITFAP
ncbi:MAG: hypothetical protein ACLFP4_08025 [Spirochaetales bacterium]